METETKSELLRYILLNKDYDTMLFKLISTRHMGQEISKIDERTFSFKVDAADGMVTAKQFLYNMNRFVRLMREYFFNVTPLPTYLDYIIDGSRSELSNLLNYKYKEQGDYYVSYNDDELVEMISKLIIHNFISNAKYIDAIKDILEEIQIPLKDVKNYNLDESLKILNLLSDIAFCQRGRGPVNRLFESIGVRLSKYDDMDTTRRKNPVEYFQKKYIKSCIEDYEKLFKTYASKKKYLKYFV